ncbi:MAG: rhodanese-like domain-containing protein [Candidatus Limimorpha sp.]
MKHLALIAMATFATCSGCNEIDGDTLLSPKEFAEAIKTDSTATILDVRQLPEFEMGHLEGAALLNVLDTMTFEAGLKTLDKEKTYYIYCRTGGRSHNAALKMQEQGFKIMELKGGITAWEKAGMTIVK